MPLPLPPSPPPPPPSIRHTQPPPPAIHYTLGAEPGDYVIITALSKDQLVWNVTFTTRPLVAPRLELPVNASLHSAGVRAGQVDPQIGTVVGVQDLVLTVSGVCDRFVREGGAAVVYVGRRAVPAHF